MDNFLFKAKRKADGKWIEGDLVHDAIDAHSMLIPIGIRSGGFYPEEVIPDTVCFYVQIEDKKGKRIFTADTMLHPDFDNGKSPVVVAFSHGCAKLNGWDCVRTDLSKGEVIGSLYDEG